MHTKKKGRQAGKEAIVNGSATAARARRRPAKKRPEPTLETSVVRRLARVAEVEAIFQSNDDRGVYHVYSVVAEHRPDVYKKLTHAEERVQTDFPDRLFAFHLRAHQGRRPVSAVPLSVKPLFAR